MAGYNHLQEVNGLTVTLNLEDLIALIETSNSPEVLRKLDEIVTEHGLMRYLPEKLRWKLIDSREPDEMTEEEEKAIREALQEDELIPHEQVLKELGIDDSVEEEST